MEDLDKMEKILVLYVVVSLILGGIGLVSGEKEDLKFKKVILNFSDIIIHEEENSISLELNGTNSEFIEKGNYIVPIRIETFLFPFGTEIINVECKPKNIHTQLLTKELLISPNPSIIGQILKNTEKTKQVSILNRWFEFDIGTGIIDNDHSTIVKILAFPVQYKPYESKLKWAQEIEINIEYIEPENMFTFGDEYDLIVITPEEFTEELIDLISHKNSNGVSTKLVSLDEIYNGDYFPIQGRDEQEKIKYFIRDSVENWGVRNVLLVGGVNLFPVRKASIFIDLDPPMNMEVKSDLYYADLYDSDGGFSSWDSNGNDIFCEYNWGLEKETDEVDFYPDVHIGRLACNNEDEISTCVNKILTYETTEAYTEDWFTDIVVLGGDTFPDYGGVIDEGEYFTDKTISLMEGFKPDKLWASTGRLSGENGVENISNALNKGSGFVVFSGHGYPHLWMTHPHKNSSKSLPGPNGRYLNTDVSNLNNEDKLPIVILFACSNSDYNIPPCFGWSFLSNPKGGGIASFGSTDTAFGYTGRAILNGAFGKITYDTLMGYRFNGAKTLGEMWSYAVTKFIHTISIDTDVLTVVEYQLFGDPTMKVAGDSTPPEKPEKPSGPNSGRKNKEYIFTTSTNDPDGDDIFYRFSWGDDEYSDWIGPFSSGEIASSSHVWSSDGNYSIMVIAKDNNGAIGSWSESLKISMPKNISSGEFDSLLIKIIQLFPIFKSLLSEYS
jgi:hypothetical protein